MPYEKLPVLKSLCINQSLSAFYKLQDADDVTLRGPTSMTRSAPDMSTCTEGIVIFPAYTYKYASAFGQGS